MNYQRYCPRLLLVVLTVFMSGCVSIVPGGPSLFDVLIGACALNGCFNPPCMVGDTLVEVNDASVPMVPDQELNLQSTSYCVIVSVVRYFENGAEREMIQRAEDFPSTTGPTWTSATKATSLRDANGEPRFVVADAVTSEALSYYAKRALSIQTSNPENGVIRVFYTARLIDEQATGGEMHGPIVHLDLDYREGYGGRRGKFYTWREVEFDQAGEVVNVRGDGEAFVGE